VKTELPKTKAEIKKEVAKTVMLVHTRRNIQTTTGKLEYEQYKRSLFHKQHRVVAKPVRYRINVLNFEFVMAPVSVPLH